MRLEIHPPSTKQALPLILSGILSAYLWVYLFGLWAANDTPLLNLEIRIGLRTSAFSIINEYLFCFLSAASFTMLLWRFYRRSFAVSSAIFITTFLLVYLIPNLVSGEVEAAFFSFPLLWTFAMFFAACALLVTRYLSGTGDK